MDWREFELVLEFRRGIQPALAGLLHEDLAGDEFAVAQLIPSTGVTGVRARALLLQRALRDFGMGLPLTMATLFCASAERERADTGGDCDGAQQQASS